MIKSKFIRCLHIHKQSCLFFSFVVLYFFQKAWTSWWHTFCNSSPFTILTGSSSVFTAACTFSYYHINLFLILILLPTLCCSLTYSWWSIFVVPASDSPSFLFSIYLPKSCSLETAEAYCSVEWTRTNRYRQPSVVLLIECIKISARLDFPFTTTE